MDDNKVLILTAEELKEFAGEAARAALLLANGNIQQPAQETKRYVYGLRGIRTLFNVSHPTAQKYKNTFLAPAVVQRGRKIIVDANLAMKLYNANLNV